MKYAGAQGKTSTSEATILATFFPANQGVTMKRTIILLLLLICTSIGCSYIEARVFGVGPR